VNINIPGFVKEIEQGKFLESTKYSREPMPFLRFAAESVPRKSNVNNAVYIIAWINVP